jgi:hypothetical protein
MITLKTVCELAKLTQMVNGSKENRNRTQKKAEYFEKKLKLLVKNATLVTPTYRKTFFASNFTALFQHHYY